MGTLASAYELQRRGFDLERIAGRVAEICGIGREEIFSRGRQKERVKARSLFCYWAVREAGIPLRELLGVWESVPLGLDMRWNKTRKFSERIITFSLIAFLTFLPASRCI